MHTFFKNKIFFLCHAFTHYTAFPLWSLIVVLPWISESGVGRRKYSTVVKLKEQSTSNLRLVYITQAFFAHSIFSYLHLSLSSLVRTNLDLCHTAQWEALWKSQWTAHGLLWDRLATSCLPWFNQNIVHFVTSLNSSEERAFCLFVLKAL